MSLLAGRIVIGIKHLTQKKLNNVISTNFYVLAHSSKGGSDMSDHVLFNLSNELRKRDKMHGLLRILLFFHNADLLKSVSDYYKRVCYNTVTILAFDMGGTNDIG